MVNYPLTISYFVEGKLSNEKYYGTYKDAYFWAKIVADQKDAWGFSIYTQGGYLLATYLKAKTRWMAKYKSYKWKI